MACVIAMLAVLCSCNLDLPKETQSSFETMTVKNSDIEVPVKFSAKMKGQADVTIMPQVSGQLMKIYVTEGQQVHKGQALFAIDSRNAQHELESARANLQAANANLQAAISQANSAKLEYESNKNLYDKQIVSNYMLESSLNTYKQAQATVSQAKASVSQAQTAVNRAKVNLGFCTITSPVAGVIGEIPVYAGDQVTPMTQLTIVSGNQKMEAEFSISESVLEAGVSSGYTQTDKALRGDSEVMPVAIRSMHRDMAKFAVAAVDDFAISDRNFQGVTMGVDRETYEQIIREMDAFRRRIVTIANSSKNVKQVYRLNLQLFPLSWPVPEENDA